MIRHVFRLVWNRKRSTLLISLEVFVCFLVLAGIFAAGIRYLNRWHEPLGFDYKNVWSAEIGGMGYGAPEEVMKTTRATVLAILKTLNSMPEVEAAAISTNQPYSNSTWISTIWVHGQPERMQRTFVSVKQREVFKLQMLTGRWLEETDVAYAYTPIVISQDLANALFGTTDPVGQDLPRFNLEGKPLAPGEKDDNDEATIYRIVGVSENYRRFGELGEDIYNTFIPIDFEKSPELPQEFMIRVRPGTTAQFEETLVHILQALAPQWTFDTEYLEHRRHLVILKDLSPLLVVAVVGGCLIMMVGLGLVGVLWLNINRRTSELGLRRAVGASAVSVRLQVMGELWALTALAILVGTAVFMQLPLLGADFGAGWSVFGLGAALAAVMLFVFVTVCAMYPAWFATQIQPAAALQYE